MRIAHLAAPAFGPFTDFALPLPATGADLHLIFGPNEAGKSSLLRAIGDLLYGIPARTTDDFLDDYKVLRIAATLVGRDGRRLVVQRRKGSKNTLIDADNAPLPDDALRGLLGVVDRDFFSTVFALDSAGLRSGAESLLQGKGDIGEALFSASLAGTPVHRIRAALEAEAAALFEGRRTQGVSLRPLVDDYKASLQRSREATVCPEDWEQAMSAVANAEAARDRLDADLAGKRTRRDWVQRCLDGLPVIGALDQLQRLRDALPRLPDLGPGFVDETEQALSHVNDVPSRLINLERTIARLEGRVAQNRPDQRVLSQAGEIDAQHEALAVQREWRGQRDALETDQARLAAELSARMRALGVDGELTAVETLRADAEAVLSLKAAAKDLETALAERRAHRDKLRERRHALDQVENSLGAVSVSDPSALRNALARTEVAAQFAVRLPELESRLAAAARDCQAKHQLLPGAPADHAAACALPAPGAAVLRQFADEDRRINADLFDANRDADEADARHRRLVGELARFEREGVLPTERDLAQARARRDRTWSRIVAVWRDGAPDDGPDAAPLEVAYPETIRVADKIADRLRADADNVAQAQALRDQIRLATTDASRARQARADAEGARADWRKRWQAAWMRCGLAPGSPQQMQEWRDGWLDLRHAFSEWQSADADLRRARTAIDEALALLRPLLLATICGPCVRRHTAGLARPTRPTVPGSSSGSASASCASSWAPSNPRCRCWSAPRPMRARPGGSAVPRSGYRWMWLPRPRWCCWNSVIPWWTCMTAGLLKGKPWPGGGGTSPPTTHGCKTWPIPLGFPVAALTSASRCFGRRSPMPVSTRSGRTRPVAT
jgi:hypothetical protein